MGQKQEGKEGWTWEEEEWGLWFPPKTISPSCWVRGRQYFPLAGRGGHRLTSSQWSVRKF